MKEKEKKYRLLAENFKNFLNTEEVGSTDFTYEEDDMLGDPEGYDFLVKGNIAIGDRDTTYITITKKGPDNFDTFFRQKQTGKEETAEGMTFDEVLSWL